MMPGVFFLVGAIVASTVSARLFSSQERGTPASRLLLVLGLALWIVAAFFLPPVAWLDRLSVTVWVAVPLRLLGAYVVGLAASKFWYAIVP